MKRRVGLLLAISFTVGAEALSMAWGSDALVSSARPEFTTEEAVLFAEGPDHAAVTVRSGDIALRLGTDTQIALGTYPVPVDFEQDMRSPDGSNYDYFKKVYSTLHVPGAKSEGPLSELLEVTLGWEAALELNPSKQASVPDDLKFTASRLGKMRGRFRKFVYDDAAPGSPEALAHARLPGFVRNFFKLNALDEDAADKVVHYYPGTPFVSHAGIISVEKVDGVPRIYVYDAVPGMNGDPQEDERYPSGIRKITPEEFFGTKDARYGAIARVIPGSPESHVRAVEAAWKRFSEMSRLKPMKDVFDYTFNWRQGGKVACSPFVWRSYVEGAHLNIVSDLGMTLIPAWVIRKKTVYDIHNNLQVTPQSLLQSLYTYRVVDFDSASMEEQLKSASEGKPMPLPPRDQRNPLTGHVLYSTDHPYVKNPMPKRKPPVSFDEAGQIGF